MRPGAAALASALLVACDGAPPVNLATNDAVNNLTIINDAAADEEARVNSQPAEIALPPPTPPSGSSQR